MEVTYTPPYTYMSGRDRSASLSVGHRCLGTQVPDRGLAEVLTSPNKRYSQHHIIIMAAASETKVFFSGASGYSGAGIAPALFEALGDRLTFGFRTASKVR